MGVAELQPGKQRQRPLYAEEGRRAHRQPRLGEVGHRDVGKLQKLKSLGEQGEFDYLGIHNTIVNCEISQFLAMKANTGDKRFC